MRLLRLILARTLSPLAGVRPAPDRLYRTNDVRLLGAVIFRVSRSVGHRAARGVWGENAPEYESRWASCDSYSRALSPHSPACGRRPTGSIERMTFVCSGAVLSGGQGLQDVRQHA